MCLSQWEVKGHHLDLLTTRFSIPLIVHRINPTKPQHILFLCVRISRCVPGLSAAQVESVFPPTEENRSVAVYRWSYDTEKPVFTHEYKKIQHTHVMHVLKYWIIGLKAVYEVSINAAALLQAAFVMSLLFLCRSVMPRSTGCVAAMAGPTETTVSCTGTPASPRPRYTPSTEEPVLVTTHVLQQCTFLL